MIEPSFQAIEAAAHTEATEVEKIMNKGEGEPTPWRSRSEESKRHWRGHVGAAVRAAYAVDFPSEGPGAVLEIKRGYVPRAVSDVVVPEQTTSVSDGPLRPKSSPCRPD